MLASIAHIKIIRTKYSFFVFMIFRWNPRVVQKMFGKKRRTEEEDEKKHWRWKWQRARKEGGKWRKELSRSYITSSKHPAKPSIYNDRKLLDRVLSELVWFFVLSHRICSTAAAAAFSHSHSLFHPFFSLSRSLFLLCSPLRISYFFRSFVCVVCSFLVLLGRGLESRLANYTNSFGMHSSVRNNQPEKHL